MINVEVESKKSESSINVLRRFSRRVQQSGIIHKFKKTQYRERPRSEYKKKVNKLERIRRREKIEQLIKEGKIQPRRRRRY